MTISQIGGEFGLIDHLAKIAGGSHPQLLVGIGDDAAVLRIAPEPHPLLLVTTDMLIEERHFTRRWSQAEQIGIKAAECNLSDIAAMGGVPAWMFVSLVIAPDIDPTWCEGLYRGLAEAITPHGVVIAGGDTTSGTLNVINITLLGQVAPQNLRLRRHARPGDLLVVTGSLGASAAALALLTAGQQPGAYLLAKHLTPRCRLDIAARIAPLARAMIDISDGLAPEVRHICNHSKVGAEIDAVAVPLHPDVRRAADLLGLDPLEFALTGGEDFELLFSIASENLEHLREIGLVLHPVGRITSMPGEAVLIRADGRREALTGGFDHFI
jgi:thiamine-monophosphate kinase